MSNTNDDLIGQASVDAVRKALRQELAVNIEAVCRRERYYDRRETIGLYLTDLEGLNRLANQRSEAGYGRKERLQEFCILGRFYMDSCGNCGPIVDGIPAKLYRVNQWDENSRCPLVMTGDELRFFMRGESYTWSHEHPFPPHYATCPLCNKGWVIEDCHDFVHETKGDYYPLDEHVGQPLSDVRQVSALVGKVMHFIEHGSVVNEGLEDKSHTTDKGVPWKYVEKDYIIEKGDVAFVRTSVYSHTTCYRRARARVQREEMEKVFADAGFPKVNLLTIPNEYWGVNRETGTAPYYADPWYLAQVDDKVPIKIGWRKRVLNIDWSESKKDLSEMFVSENVTKDATLIHAWSYAKASEYLSKIIPALPDVV
jgi:hypothetical protein